jgi:hypothetical protein
MPKAGCIDMDHSDEQIHQNPLLKIIINRPLLTEPDKIPPLCKIQIKNLRANFEKFNSFENRTARSNNWPNRSEINRGKQVGAARGAGRGFEAEINARATPTTRGSRTSADETRRSENSRAGTHLNDRSRATAAEEDPNRAPAASLGF